MRSKWFSLFIIFNLLIASGITALVIFKPESEESSSGEDECRALFDLVIFSNGIGISNLTELQNMSSNVFAHYYLMNDIDCTNSSQMNGGLGFLPIGNLSSKFNGSFDGQDFKLINLTINRSGEDYVGLFGFVNDSVVIENVKFINVNVNGRNHAGALAGVNNGTIRNGSSTGRVNGTNYLGGLVGVNLNGTITNSNCWGIVNGSGFNLGGLAGNNTSEINYSHSYSEVMGIGNYIGGLVGWNIGNITQSSGHGNVYGETEIGGLVGKNFDGNITNCSSTSYVNASGHDCGGLVGRNTGNITNCYSTGLVEGNQSYVGGLVGNNTGNITNCYSTGDVIGKVDNIGGLIGYNQDAIIKNCSSSGHVYGYDDFTGGLIGNNKDGTIENCSSTSDVNGTNYYTGGLIGYTDGGYINNSWHTGTLRGDGWYNGGLIGYNAGSAVNSSYSTGTLSGKLTTGGLIGRNHGSITRSYSIISIIFTSGGNTGGLVAHNFGLINQSFSSGWIYVGGSKGGLVSNNENTGYINNSYSTCYVGKPNSAGLVYTNDGIIDNCYSTGYLDSAPFTSGFVYTNSGYVNNSFWDKESSAHPTSAGGGTPKTTSEMKNKTTFTNAGWNFSGVWNITENVTYPYFDYYFTAPPKIISGAAYTDFGLTKTGGGKQINIIANGVELITATDAFSNYTMLVHQDHYSSGDLVLSYINGDSIKGNTIIHSDGTNLTDLDIYGDYIISRSQTGAGVANTDLIDAKGSFDDSDILYVSSGTDLTLTSGINFMALDNYILDGDITTSSGIINFSSAATLAADVTFTAPVVIFNSTLDGAYDLTTTGETHFGGQVGGSVKLGILKLKDQVNIIHDNQILTADEIIFESTFVLASLGFTINAKCEIYEDISVISGQVYNGEVTLLNGDRELTGSVIQFNGKVVNDNGGLTVAGAAELGSDITTKRAQIYKGAVTLTGNVKLDTGLDRSDIIFEGTVDGTFNFTLNSGAGDIIFFDGVGTTGRIYKIRVTGAHNVTTNAIIQAYYYVQTAGTGTTNFTSGYLELGGGMASITTKNAVGSIGVGILLLGTDYSDLTGTIEGVSGKAAVDKIQLLKAIRMNTNFFDGIDIFNFTPADVHFAKEDVFYEVDYEAIYPEGEPLFWDLDSDTDFLSINPVDGLLFGLPENDDVGYHWVNVSVSDTYDAFAYHNFTLYVQNTNDAPRINTTPITTAVVGDIYSYDVDAHDDDLLVDVDEKLSFKLDEAPGGMAITLDGGYIQWRPQNKHAGKEVVVVVNVTDGEFHDLQAFTINVIYFNTPPRIYTNDVLNAVEDTLYSVNYTATDDDPTNDILSWDLATNADWLDMGSATGILSGTPENSDVGDFWVNVTVSDGKGGSDYSYFTLTVLNVNDAPTITTTDVKSATEDVHYTVDYDAVDIDPTNDILSWNIDTNALWLSINSSTGNLTGTPENDDVGSYIITVLVSDGDAKDSTTFVLEVVNTNDEPIWTKVPENQVITEGEPLLLEISAFDEDGDKLYYGLKSEPISGLKLLDKTGPLSWLNPVVGNYTITVSVSDNMVSINHVFTILVNKKEVVTPKNNPPVIEEITETQEVSAGESFELTLIGTDVDFRDASNLSFSLKAAPSGMVISKDGTILWVPGKDQIGTHTIIVALTDTKNSTLINFTIEVTEPEDEVGAEEDKDKVDKSTLNQAYSAIALLAVLLIILIVLLVMRSRKEPEEEPKVERKKPSEIELIVKEAPKKVEDEEDLFKCSECGTLIKMGEYTCPECGEEFDDSDFEDAIDEEDLEEE
ncbi:MAG: putative Ig domain-containing protein [Thermoplasmata archaeon]|nr:MAG: putative Ig domain-containing protein [Thermoplasmata archaeon]